MITELLNGYLAAACEAVVAQETGEQVALADFCNLVPQKVPCDVASLETYVSTESLLANKLGRQCASSLPQSGKVTPYEVGDILISNIRPYFKKIWLADCDGTCSGDVLVFRAKKRQLAPYLYSILRSDSFFDFVMKGSKGTKMPRGDKKQILSYRVVTKPCLHTIDLVAVCTAQISTNNQENLRLTSLRDTLLPKLMSGEIDVSKVDLTQLNSHLASCGLQVTALALQLFLLGLFYFLSNRIDHPSPPSQ